MNAHTPAPWTWDDEDDELRGGPERTIVLDGVSWNTGDAGVACDNPDDRALIAAAPELLAALEAVLAFETDEVNGPWPQAVAAIKKAKGQS